MSNRLGLEINKTVSPSVERKMVYAGACAASFIQAQEHMRELAELSVSSQRIRRSTLAIGNERRAQQVQRVEAFKQLPILKTIYGKPDYGISPSIACVMTDGGRIQIFDRTKISSKLAPLTPSPPSEAPDEPSRKGKHWRESRVACLLSMHGEIYKADPTPNLPAFIRNSAAIGKLFSEMGHGANVDDSCALGPLKEAPRTESDWSGPKVLVRSVVASREDWKSFGYQVATEAWHRSFTGAQRKVFVGDGSSNNWTLHKQHFYDYTPILDVLHALGYGYQAALAGRRNEEGLRVFQQWAQWIWSGRVGEVIDALQSRQKELGDPPSDATEEDPRKLVHRALIYYQNQQDRMDYPTYRQQGLPITSSLIESTIKQINQRVKGSEKFWSSDGGDIILRLRADCISDTKPLNSFWTAKRKSNFATHQLLAA